MSGAPSRLQAFIRSNIPISAAMGVTVTKAGPEGVTLRAPLTKNRNHHGTLFGGSASALAMLAAWSWLHLRLEELGLDPDLVIQKGATDYICPGRDTDVVAVCAGTDEETFARFIRSLGRFGRARIALEVEVSSGDRLVARLAGQFVALGISAG